MAERPILFSPKLVRAIRSNCKTETRRLVTPRTVKDGQPVIQAGDVLWVREAFARTWSDQVLYRADYPGPRPGDIAGWKPSIHMPKDLCRYRLKVLETRIESLHSMDDIDAIREGISSNADDALADFRELWDAINGSRCRWGSNPTVVVIRFRMWGPIPPLPGYGIQL